MQAKTRILIVGGGIGGLTSAIALRQRDFDVELIEREPNGSVSGVGILQQANVVRAVAQLGILDEYLGAGFGFDFVDVYGPDGVHRARVPSPKLVPGHPANLGISRPAVHEVLSRRARASGARIRLGLTAPTIEQDARAVQVGFSDGTRAAFDLVIGADGLYSKTRELIFPEAAGPAFAGQGVWRYNFERPAELESLWASEGHMGLGLVPLSTTLMYLYLTTAEPGNPHYAASELAASMRAKLQDARGAFAGYANRIRDDAEVIYRPLECVFLNGDWHKGRVVLLGDAVHATTPHLGQGGGMAIEDSLVLAEELARANTPEQAFRAYRQRRFERCRYVAERSQLICNSQLGRVPPVEQAMEVREMFRVLSAPI